MAKGEFKNHPLEVRKVCPYCTKEMHHQGYGSHIRWCAVKTKTKRDKYIESNKYWKGKSVKIPATVRAIPYAYIENGEVETRVHLSVSADKNALKAVIDSLKLEIEDKK